MTETKLPHDEADATTSADDSDVVRQARMHDEFVKKWEDKGDADFLQPNIDPNDAKGLKCGYIDLWSRHYVNRFVVQGRVAPRVLEIGCGTGRNLFALASEISEGWGVDVSKKMIQHAKERARRRNVTNLRFTDEPEEFLRLHPNIDVAFTMWVLGGFRSDDAILAVLGSYLTALPKLNDLIFFEQAAESTHDVYHGERYHKKVRSLDDYAALFRRAGLEVIQQHVICEKGYGAFYRRLYMSPLYKHWPKRLDVNRAIFAADRLLTRRYVRTDFTDCVFVCRRRVV